MLGYAGDEAKTAEVTRAGHYHTGDVAQRDEEGYITYVGRPTTSSRPATTASAPSNWRAC